MESTLRRRLLIAASAGLACLLPVACDAAAASPESSSYHRPTDKPTNTKGRGHNHGTGTGTGTGTNGGTGAATATGDPTASATDDPSASGDPTATDTSTSTAGVGGNGGTGATGGAGTVGAGGADGNNNGLQVLARDCSGSKLQPHTGFQIAPACVNTQFGEVASAANDPSLLITDAPRTIAANTPFNISVSTRNLIRDRFLGAAVGGYYLESSVLKDGIQRGHFHTACRILTSTSVAPDPAPVPAFFKATEDGKGGRTPDTVQVQLTSGLPSAGLFQCAVWAGDGSHRTPMMERANQTPAFDVVRIRVT